MTIMETNLQLLFKLIQLTTYNKNKIVKVSISFLIYIRYNRNYILSVKNVLY